MIHGKKNFVRGDHAHKKCSQFLFPVLGKIKVEYFSQNKNGEIKLNHKKREGFLAITGRLGLQILQLLSGLRLWTWSRWRQMTRRSPWHLFLRSQ